MSKKISVAYHMNKIFNDKKTSDNEKLVLIFDILDRLEIILHWHKGMWPIEDIKLLIQLSNNLEAVKKEFMYDVSITFLEKALTVRTFTAIGGIYGVKYGRVSNILHRYIRLLSGIFRRKINATQSEDIRKSIRMRY